MKNWIRHDPVRSRFGCLRVKPRAGEAPDDYEAREALDERVDPEAGERDRSGDDAGGDPMMPSAPIQASESQESIRARRAARSHSFDRAGGAACPTTVSSRMVVFTRAPRHVGRPRAASVPGADAGDARRGSVSSRRSRQCCTRRARRWRRERGLTRPAGGRVVPNRLAAGRLSRDPGRGRRRRPLRRTSAPPSTRRRARVRASRPGRARRGARTPS